MAMRSANNHQQRGCFGETKPTCLKVRCLNSVQLFAANDM